MHVNFFKLNVFLNVLKIGQLLTQCSVTLIFHFGLLLQMQMIVENAHFVLVNKQHGHLGVLCEATHHLITITRLLRIIFIWALHVFTPCVLLVSRHRGRGRHRCQCLLTSEALALQPWRIIYTTVG